MQRSLLRAALNQRHKNYLQFLPTTHFKIHPPLKNWSVILPAHTLAGLIFSIASCTKSLPKRKRFASCACGRTTNEPWALTVQSSRPAVQRWVCRFSGLRLLAWRHFLVLLASSPCVSSVSSYCFGSATQPWWHSACSQFVPVAREPAPGKHCPARSSPVAWVARNPTPPPAVPFRPNSSSWCKPGSRFIKKI